MAPVRIGTCSWADDALNKHWYPKGLPAKERLAWYAERFSTVEVDSTFYRVPDEPMVQDWADRTPAGFVMHVKAFGLMTRHPVKLEQLPPDLRDGMPLDARGRVDRPEPEQRAVVFREFLGALEPLRAAGKLGGILFQMPPYIVPKPSSFAYLEWARDAARRRRDARRVPPPRLVRRGRPRRAPRLARGAADVARRRRCPAPRRGERPVDARRRDRPDRLRPLPRPQRRHLEQARRRRGRALRLHLRPTRSSRAGSSRSASCPRAAEETFAFFNNNNQTDGVAQAPAGAELLRRLLEEEAVAVG